MSSTTVAVQHDRKSVHAAALTLGAVLLTVVLVARPGLAGIDLGAAAPLLVLLGFAFGGLVVRYSAAGLPLLVVFVYLNLSEALVRFHGFPSLLQLLVAALAFGAWLKRETDHIQAVGAQPLTIALALYLLFVFVSTAYARDRLLADDRLFDLAKAFVLYLLATMLMQSRRRVAQGIYAIVAAAASVGLIVLYQIGSGQLSNDFGGLARVKQAHIYGDVVQPRISGPIGDPNFFAQVLLLTIPLAVVLGVAESRRRIRMAWLAGSAIIFVVLLSTYSRGAMLALGVMALLMLRHIHIRWTTTAAAAATLLVLFILLPASVTERMVTIEQILPSAEQPLDPDSSFQERRLLMTVAWVMFGANPIGGVGIGNYSSRYEDYVGGTSSVMREYAAASDLHYPHNLPLEVAAETGIAGLILFGVVLVACWNALRDAEKAFAENDRQLALIALALRVSLAGFLVASLFLHLAVPRHLFLIFALAASLQRLGRPAMAADNRSEDLWGGGAPGVLTGAPPSSSPGKAVPQ